MNNEIQHKIGTFTKVNIDTGEICYNGTIDTTVEEAIVFLKSIYDLMGNQPFYLLNTFRQTTGSLSPEVWHFLGTDPLHNSMIKASGVITDSPGYQMQVKFFSKKFPIKYPLKLFTNIEDAKSWFATLETTVQSTSK